MWKTGIQKSHGFSYIRVIHSTQDMATNILFPQCLFILFGLLQGQLASPLWVNLNWVSQSWPLLAVFDVISDFLACS